MAAIQRIREMVGAQEQDQVFAESSGSRGQTPLVYEMKQLFRTGTFFPLADARRRIGVLIRGEVDAGARRRITAWIAAARTETWTAHLLWIDGPAAPPDSFLALFESIVRLSAKTFMKAGLEKTRQELMGLMCIMDIMVNHECPEWLTLSGDLKRLGVRTLFSAGGAVDRAAAHAMFLTGLHYEYSVAGYLSDSVELLARMKASGVPAAKLFNNLHDFTEQNGS
jgi:hypothetical protein